MTTGTCKDIAVAKSQRIDNLIRETSIERSPTGTVIGRYENNSWNSGGKDIALFYCCLIPPKETDDSHQKDR